MKYFAKYLPVEGEIKEGDEFEHEEVGLNGIWQNWNSKTPLSGKNIVFVKGPCGHFH